MSLITCDNNCVYQHDGYCTLNTPAVVTEYNENSNCIHFIKRESKLKSNLSYSIESFPYSPDSY